MDATEEVDFEKTSEEQEKEICVMSLCVFLFMVCLLTLNIRGVCNMDKVDNLFTVKIDILCLQEVRWNMEPHAYAQQLWGGSSFYAAGPDGSARVAVFVRNSVFDGVTLLEADPAGRKLILDLEWADMNFR